MARRTSLGFSLALVLLASPAAAVVCDDYQSLVASYTPTFYFRLGETSGTTAVDAAGCQDGTYNGTVTLGVTGAIINNANTAISVNATGDFVSTVDQTCNDLTSAAATWCAWFKANQSPMIGDHIIVAKDSQFLMGWDFAAGTMVCGDRISGVDTFVGSNTGVDDGNWHSVCCVNTGTTLLAYTDDDATPNSANSPDGALDNQPNGPSIGCFSSGAAGCSSALNSSSIDEVFAVKSALTAQQITDLYVAGDTGCTAPDTPTSTPTSTPTPTPTATPTNTPTPTRTPTPTSTATNTPGGVGPTRRPYMRDKAELPHEENHA